MVDSNLISKEKNLILFKIWSDVYGIIQKVELNELKNLDNELRNILAEGKEKQASKILLRLNNSPMDETVEKLQQNGFEKKSERIEFKTSIEKFNFSNEAEIQFKSASEMGYLREDVAKLVNEISYNDPDFSPSEDCYEFTDDWYHDSILTSGPEYIFIGFDSLVPVSLVVTQVDLSKGWGRLSYIGVLPSFRSKSVGKLTHQFGIMKLKEIGATVYHGGTNILNFPMIKLFNENKCEFFRKQEEWECEMTKWRLLK